MIRSFAIIMIFYFIGQVLTTATGIIIPGSVLGMVLLLVALNYRLVSLGSVLEASELLLDNLMFLFLPAAVGIILYLDVISNSLFLILSTTVVGTLLVIFVVGKVYRLLAGKGEPM